MELFSISIAAEFAQMLPTVILMLQSLVPLIIPSLVTLVAAGGRMGTAGVSMRGIVYFSNDISTLIELMTFGSNALSNFVLKSIGPGTSGTLYPKNVQY